MIKKTLRLLAKWLAGAFVCFLVAMGLGAAPIPASGWDTVGGDEPAQIFILSNGFHSDIAIPKALAEAHLPISTQDFPVDADAVQHYAIGWGSKTAYTSLRTVSDLTPSIITRALAFDETVVHITPLGALQPSQNVFVLNVKTADIIALMLDISRFFGRPEPIANLSQGFGDRYYAGLGRFSPWSTCNSWTGRRLRAMGINVGLWTPTAQSLEYGLYRAGAITSP